MTLGGDLTCVSGIGASAANVVSLARAVVRACPWPAAGVARRVTSQRPPPPVPLQQAEAQGKKLTEAQINAAGYEGPHPAPSLLSIATLPRMLR